MTNPWRSQRLDILCSIERKRILSHLHLGEDLMKLRKEQAYAVGIGLSALLLSSCSGPDNSAPAGNHSTPAAVQPASSPLQSGLLLSRPIVPPDSTREASHYKPFEEADMRVIQGRVQRFLLGSSGGFNAFILDRGIEVRFPSAQLREVSHIVEVGSNVEIQGWTRPGTAGAMQLDASTIMNSDSKRMIIIKQFPPPKDPGVLPSSMPTSEKAASLGPPHHAEQAASRYATREGAAKDIERAYDSLHRTQAILAYVKIVDLKDPNVGDLLEEAKRTYEQALSTYQKENFSAAGELAAASNDLTTAIEMVISWTFRSSTNTPTLVPAPPMRQATSTESAGIQERLLSVQKSLFRIRWLVENGTMPLDDVEEVRKIAAWSDAFLVQARQMFQRGQVEGATEFAQAAEAVLHSAEHRSKKCYVALESDSHFVSTAASLH
jgi:hypothetical protein